MKKVTRAKPNGYFRAPDFIFDLPLSEHAKIIFLNLCRRSDKHGLSYPSLNRISQDCSIHSRTTISRALTELVKAGLLVKKRNGYGSNIYCIPDRFLPKKGSVGVVYEMNRGCSRDEQGVVHEMNTKEFKREGKTKRRKGQSTKALDGALCPALTCQEQPAETLDGGFSSRDPNGVAKGNSTRVGEKLYPPQQPSGGALLEKPAWNEETTTLLQKAKLTLQQRAKQPTDTTSLRKLGAELQATLIPEDKRREVIAELQKISEQKQSRLNGRDAHG